jgi:hypothetical protein
MVMLHRAFFDASRTQRQSGAYVIGGYVGTEALWTALEAEWQANLKYWEITDFHLTDCLAKRGQFSRLDTHKSELCALSFGQILKDANPVVVWSGLLDEEWSALAPSPAFRARYPTPYQFLFHDILWQLGAWRHQHARGEMVAPVFDVDADPRSVRPILDSVRSSPLYEDLVAGVTFGSRRVFVPLQAADIIAGEMQRHWFEREYPADDDAFPGFRNLLLFAVPRGSVGGLWTPATLQRAMDTFDRIGDPFSWSSPGAPA